MGMKRQFKYSVWCTALTFVLGMAMLACEQSIIDISKPPPNWENEIENGGEFFIDFRYKIDNGSITILRYNGKGGLVSIPSEIDGIPVTSIGIYSFRETKLTDIIIPDSITLIEKGSFYGNQLTSVIIPNRISSIADLTFIYNKLISVVIPNGVTSIGKHAFEWNQLNSVTIPDSVTSLGIMHFAKIR